MFEKSIRFECLACGECCRWEGFAFVLPSDARRLADHLALPLQDFVDRHCHHVLIDFHYEEEIIIVPWLVLQRDPMKGHCIFLSGTRCQIHEAKPIHCSQTPFVGEFMMDEEALEFLKKNCPGMDRGPVHGPGEIDDLLTRQDQREQAYEEALEACDWDLERVMGIKLAEPLSWDELQQLYKRPD